MEVLYPGTSSAVIVRLWHATGCSYPCILDANEDQFVAVLYFPCKLYGTYITLIFEGIASVFDRVHTVSDSVPIDIVVNALQALNAELPILVAAGNDTLVNLLQERNAELPILVAAGNDTFVNALQE